MRRVVAAAAIGLVGAVITMSPLTAALAAEPAGTVPPALPTPSPSSTNVSPTDTASTSASSTSLPSESVPLTSVPSAHQATRPSPVPPPVASARAANDAAVNIITNATTCAYFCFSPGQTTIAVGDTVTWTNKTSAEHIVARCTPANCDNVSGGTGIDANFASAQIALPAGKTFRYTFTAPGTYVYYCTIHGYSLMHGTITVTDAASTTTAAPATTVAPAPTAADPRQLAHTGSRAGSALVVAMVLVVVGLTATSFQLRRRHL